MIVDTSAILAIVLEEPERDMMLRRILEARERRISAGTWMELATVITRRHPEKAHLIETLLWSIRLTISDVTPEQARLGRDGYRAYGRGTGHPARLNFGDCFAYALAKATGEPLLFKGDDFVHTDVTAAA
ncbi:type II toxin-antitoxin system VapC family toxin [Sphingomonas gei]|uniref:Ribonuclease VapC n=1 Tax=Sphingomonas gei TaxID=1395960 RepID=A0A4S1XHQ4_9SPHN|nr:type II toxin-antitoxin system VapC family toxin [Sphingomonas gei]TGX55575.1 type II toxin-antitoxin system VapC family toxin [Sphingomonas gei]